VLPRRHGRVINGYVIALIAYELAEDLAGQNDRLAEVNFLSATPAWACTRRCIGHAASRTALQAAVSGQPMETLDMCESDPDESSQCLLNNEELTQLAT